MQRFVREERSCLEKHEEDCCSVLDSFSSNALHGELCAPHSRPVDIGAIQCIDRRVEKFVGFRRKAPFILEKNLLFLDCS